MFNLVLSVRLLHSPVGRALAALHGLQDEFAEHGIMAVQPSGCGSKINRRGYAGFGPRFHLPGFHFGYRSFEPQLSVAWPIEKTERSRLLNVGHAHGGSLKRNLYNDDLSQTLLQYGDADHPVFTKSDDGPQMDIAISFDAHPYHRYSSRGVVMVEQHGSCCLFVSFLPGGLKFFGGW